MSIDDVINQFYISYHEWLIDDAPESSIVFDRCLGLCSSLQSYILTYDLVQVSKQLLFAECLSEFQSKLGEQFIAAGLDRHYPFCDAYQYDEERRFNRSYLNPERRKWVSDRVQLISQN